MIEAVPSDHFCLDQPVLFNSTQQIHIISLLYVGDGFREEHGAGNNSENMFCPQGALKLSSKHVMSDTKGRDKCD
jgi:hypothetical protein